MVEIFDLAPEADLSPEVGLLLATLDAGTIEWREELGDVPSELFSTRAFSDGPSIGALLHHVACSEAWWTETIIGGRAATEAFDSDLVEGETDPSSGQWSEAPRMAFSALVSKMDEVRARTRAVLRTEVDPERVIPIPQHLQHMAPSHSGFTVRWVVAHVAQHEAYHGGQAVMIKRMLTGRVW